MGVDRRGFTLIELMVVLDQIGRLTAMIVPEMKGTFEDSLLRAAGREFVNACNLAYSRAVTLNVEHRLRIEKSTGRYYLEKRAPGAGKESYVPIGDVPGAKGRIDARISLEFQRPGEETSALGEEMPAAAGGETPVREVGESIAFYADGTADARSILLQDRNGFRLALRVSPITARVHIIELERK